MKMMVVVVLALVAIAAAAPVEPGKPVVLIVRSEFSQSPEGGYVFSFESDDGIKRAETGEVKEVLDEENKPQNVVVTRGSYSYPKGDGNVETINYVADETGFHPEGESIPKVVS